MFGKKCFLTPKLPPIENRVFSWKKMTFSPRETSDMYSVLEEKLIEADFGGENSLEIVDILKKDLPNPESYCELKEKLKELLKGSIKSNALDFKEDRLNVLLISGINGVGKTTTISKFIYYYIHQKGLKPEDILLGAGDTFRDAAREQLEYWGEYFQVKVIGQKQGSDPSSVVFDTISSGLSQNKKLVIIDTSGRIHNKVNLMSQLDKMNRVFNKFTEPIHKKNILILDITQGSNSYEQAEEFHKKIIIDTLVLTKLDSQAKGGGIYRISKKLDIPVNFVTYGERPEKIKEFNLNEYIEALFE